MKPEEIRAQISSLNDELKDTIKEVNARHGERDLLLKQSEELEGQRVLAQEELEKQKEVHLRIRSEQESELDVIRSSYNNILKDIESGKLELNGLDESIKQHKRNVDEMVDIESKTKSKLVEFENKIKALGVSIEFLGDKEISLNEDIKSLDKDKEIAESNLFIVAQRERNLSDAELKLSQDKKDLKTQEKNLKNQEVNLKELSKQLTEKLDVVKREQEFSKELVKSAKEKKLIIEKSIGRSEGKLNLYRQELGQEAEKLNKDIGILLDRLNTIKQQELDARSKIKVAREEQKQEEEFLQKNKQSFQATDLSHKRKIQQSNEVIQEKQKELGEIVQRVMGLSNKESELRNRIKELKDDKKKLLEIRKELEEAEKSRPLIEAIKKELFDAVDNLEEAKVELDITHREAWRVKEQSNKERSEHLAWLEETKAKTKSEVEGSVQLRIVWETKLQDLKIVEKRLKKLWEQSSKLPFPTIYRA